MNFKEDEEVIEKELKNKIVRFNEILEKIKQSIDIICECEKEKHVQDVLASQLNCKTRQTLSTPDFPDIEVDLIGEDYVIEVKYNEKYYSGLCQVLAQRLLYDFENICLIHVNDYINTKIINAFFKLAKELKILGILINKRSKEIWVKP